MKTEEEEFWEAMAQLEPQPQPLTEEEMLRLHTRTLEKAGLKKKKTRPALRVCKWAAMAAVMVFALFGAGATYFKVSDLFRGALMADMNETSPFSAPAPQTGDVGLAGGAKEGYLMPEAAYEAATADMGAMLKTAQQQRAGVTLQAEGFLADADTLLLMLSAESADGIFTGDLQLGEVWLSSAAPDGTVYNQRLCDIEAMPSGDGKTARFLVKDTLTQNIAGQALSLTVTDIERFENSRGEALALRQDDLYAFWLSLEETQRNTFEKTDGQLTLHSSDGGVPLLQDDDSLLLTAMGIRDGVFYFNVTAAGAEGRPPVENLILKNKDTGALLTGFTAVTGTQGRFTYRFEIPGIENARQLARYTLVKNGGWCSVKAAEGVWNFEITPSYKNLSRTFSLDLAEDTVLGALHFDSLTVSPISLSLTGTTPFEPDFGVLAAQPRLIMQDGGLIHLDSMQASYTADGGVFTLNFLLPRMIEPDKLAGLETDGLSLNLSCVWEE